MAIEGRPAAFGEKAVFGDKGRFVEVDEDEIRPIAFAKVASFLDLEEVGHGVTGLAYDGLESQLSRTVEFEQNGEAVLKKGQARGAVEVTVLYLFPSVRGMVGGYDVDAVLVDGLEDSFSIGGSLDCGVALDELPSIFVG